jgi:hypothetical protein
VVMRVTMRSSNAPEVDWPVPLAPRG